VFRDKIPRERLLTAPFRSSIPANAGRTAAMLIDMSRSLQPVMGSSVAAGAKRFRIGTLPIRMPCT
jgi:hypothetical protein